MITTISIALKFMSIFLQAICFSRQLSYSTKDKIRLAIGVSWSVCAILDVIRGIQLLTESGYIFVPLLYAIVVVLDIFNAYSYLKNGIEQIKKKYEDIETSEDEDFTELNRLI